MEENNVNSFTFYRDYYNLVDTMPDKDKKELLVAITDYVFKDKDPNLTGHNKAIFNTLKNQLNVSKNNSKRSIKTEPKENRKVNQKETGRKPEDKPNSRPEQNKTSVLSFKFYISNFKLINSNNLVIEKLEEWFNYKKQRKDKYTEIGLKSLLKKVDTNIEKYGYQKIIKLIDESMANNYQGIIWEKLEKQNTKRQMANKYQTREEVDGVYARFMEGEENEQS